MPGAFVKSISFFWASAEHESGLPVISSHVGEFKILIFGPHEAVMLFCALGQF